MQFCHNNKMSQQLFYTNTWYAISDKGSLTETGDLVLHLNCWLFCFVFSFVWLSCFYAHFNPNETKAITLVFLLQEKSEYKSIHNWRELWKWIEQELHTNILCFDYIWFIIKQSSIRLNKFKQLLLLVNSSLKVAVKNPTRIIFNMFIFHWWTKWQRH